MEIHFYVLCTEKLNYADYIKKVLPVKSALSALNNTEHYFQLRFGGETVTISFEERQFPKLPSELIFA